MAKDFYKYDENGELMHMVVMGMSKYKDYWAAGWTNHIPKKPLVAESTIDPFEGMENDEDMKDVVEKLKTKKGK